MALTILLVVLGALSGCVNSLPAGPGIEVLPAICGTLDPSGGHGSRTTTGTGPYTITTSANTYSLNLPLQVTISSNPFTQFRGFIIQARRSSDNLIVGTWSNLPAGTQGGTCNLNPSANGGYDASLLGEGSSTLGNTWGHSSNSDKNSVTGSWTSSFNQGSIYFEATVVQGNPNTRFYTSIKSNTISLSTAQAAVQCPTVQSSSSNQITFSSPTLTNFVNPNGATVTYTFFGQTLSLPASQQTHTLTNFNNGGNTISVTASDGTSTAFCTFTYNRLSTAAVQCPTVQSSSSNQITFSSPTLTNFVNPNGATVTYNFFGQTLSLPASQQTHTLTNFNVGGNTISVTASDGTSTASCTFTYNRLSTAAVQCPTVPPSSSNQITFSSPTLTNFVNPIGATVTYTYNGQTLSFPASQQTHTLTNLNVGVNTIIVTVTALDGSTASCTFTYIRLAPLILTCPPNEQAFAQAGQSGVIVNYGQATTTGGTNPVNIGYSNPSGSVFVVGRTPVSVTASDGSGNFQTCTFDVVVTISAAPLVLTCPQNQFATAPAGQNVAQVTYNGVATPSGGSPPYNAVIYNPPSGSFFVVGQTTVTASVTDNAGTVRTCTFTVTVTAPLVLTCPQNQFATASAEQNVAQVTYNGVASPSGGSTPYNTVTYNPPSGSFFVAGQTTLVTASVTDNAGTVQTCTFTVTVNQATAPLGLTCPQNQFATASAGQTVAQVTYNGVATPSGGSPPYNTVTYNPPSGSFFVAGQTTSVTASVTDNAGTVQTCTFTVTVNQATAPLDLTCPQNQFATASAGQSTAQVTYNGVATPSGGSTPYNAVTYNPPSGSFFVAGQTTLVTASVTDNAGTVQTCTFTVTVNQATAPLGLTCPQNQFATASAGQTVAQVTYNGVATPSGGSPPYNTVTYNPPSGSFFVAGQTTSVTASVTDNAGTVQTCTFTVTVNQATAPLDLTCPQNQFATASAGQSTAQVTYNGVATPSGGSTPYNAVTYNPPSGSFFVAGQTTLVTASVTDNAGTVQTCTFTVTVNQATAPLGLTCPQNQFATASAGQTVAQVTYNGVATPSGGSPPYNTVTYNPPSGSFFVAGQTTSVTASVTDNAGTVQTCTFTVTVNQATAPLDLTCPQNQFATASAGQSTAQVTYNGVATPSGGSTPYNAVTYNPPSGSFFVAGQTTLVTASVRDNANTVQSCTFTVTVNQATTPLGLTCPQNQFATASAGQNVAQVTYNGVATPSGGSPPYNTVTYNPPSGSFFVAGQTTSVTASVTDNAGTVQTCTFTVTVNQATAPLVLTCPQNQVATATTGQFVVPVTYNGVATPSGGSTPYNAVTYNPPTGSFFVAGQTTSVTASVTDNANTVQSCTFTVTVNQAAAPLDLTCPQNQFATASAGQNVAQVTYNGVATPSGGSTPYNAVTYNPPSGSFFVAGQTTLVTASVRDNANTVQSCTFTVTVNQAADPLSIQCPNNAVGQFQCGANTATVSFNPAVASGGTGTINTVTYGAGSTGAFFSGVGANNQVTGTFPSSSNFYQVTASVTNTANQNAQCTFNVQLSQAADTQLPVFTQCGQTQTASIPCGQTTTQVTFQGATATDNCGVQNVGYSAGNIQISNLGNNLYSGNFGAGTTVVTVTATDTSGRTATCTFDVIVTQAADIVPPTITQCVQSTNANIPCGQTSTAVTFQGATATDNCGVASVAYSANNVQFSTLANNLYSGNFGPGTTVVTATATDGSGRTATCTFTVTVSQDDSSPPTITCPAERNCVVPNTQVTIPNAVANDNCGVASTQYTTNRGNIAFIPLGNSQLATFPQGVTTVTATATDGGGRTDTCSFDVRTDQTQPTITCPQPAPSTVACGQTSTQVQFNRATANDDCGVPNVVYSSSNIQFVLIGNNQVTGTFNNGLTTVIATATDGAQLTATCQFQVTVNQVDSANPTIQCTSGITESVSCGTNNLNANFPATATDDCGAVTVTYSSTGATTFDSQVGSSAAMNIGTSVVTATATDGTGKTTTCQTTVIINAVDSANPTIECAPEITESVSCGTNNFNANFPATATDDCGAVTVRYSSTGATTFNSQVGSSAAMNIGTSVVTATATDGTGKTTTCQTTVIINAVDSANPTIECVPEITESVSCGTNNFNANFPATATDDCGAVTVRYSSTGATTFNSQVGSSAAMNIGTSLVTATATDGTGKTTTCQTTVVINAADNANPTISCTSNFQQTVPCGTPSFLASYPATATDDCPGTPSITYSSTGATIFTGQTTSSGNLNVGQSIVTATATDASSRSSTCQTIVTVTAVDNQPPTISCPQNQQDTVCTGSTTSTLTFPAAVGQDNCAAQVTVRYSSTGATTLQPQTQRTATFNQGTSIVTATVTDGSQQTATCQFQITVTAQNPCANNNCQNGGQCTAFPGSCTQYYCSCPPCYYGTFCENRVDQCQNHKCRNGAVCQPQPNSCTDYTCACTGCFTGNFCEDTFNPCAAGNNQCQNGAVCSNLNVACNAYSCQCTGCFTGYRCDQAIPNPCNNNPCQNNGQCSRIQGQCFSYQCTCQPGFTGFNCQIPNPVYVNPCNNLPCQSGGTCTCLDNNRYACSCVPGYGGINCQNQVTANPTVESCANQPCQNGGQCYNGHDQNSAPNNIYRNQYTCVCATSFSGVNCGSSAIAVPSLNQCNQNPCRNGGECRNAYFSFSQNVEAFCICPIGFAGQYCERSVVNPCNSNPCQNNAQCTPFNSYFVCACQPSYSGTTCEIATTDTINPVITCPANQIGNVDISGQSTAVTYPPATATDNSGTPLISYDRPSGSVFPYGATTVTATATDAAGNTAQCTFVVTVQSSADTTPPVVTCPETQVQSVAQVNQPATVTYPSATATDNSGQFVQLSYSQQSGSIFNYGPTLVTVTGTDPSGNQGQCTFTVTVQVTGLDMTPPTIIGCPTAPISVTGVTGGQVPVSFNAPTCTDASGVLSLTSTLNGQTSITLPVGIAVVVEYICTDNANNVAQCAFTLETSNANGPVIFNCPSTVIDTYQPSEFVKTITWTPPTSNGNLVAGSPSHTPPAIFGRGCTAVSYRYTLNGLSSICSFPVCVWPAATDIDNEPPVLTCPQNQVGQVNQPITYAASATDNSGGNVALSYSTPPGSTFNVGVNAVTVAATDPSGNTATCTFTVTIQATGVDTTPPTIIGCPTAPISATGVTGGQLPVSFTAPTCTDASGVQSLTSTFGGQTSITLPVGIAVVVEYICTDNANNVARCAFTLETSNANGPVIANCPSSVIDTYQPSEFAKTITWTPPTSNGNLVAGSPSHTPPALFGRGCTAVSYTYTLNGLSSICSFPVCVWPADTVTNPLALTCPADVPVSVAQGTTSTNVNFNTASPSGGNPPYGAVQCSRNSGSTFTLGSTQVTCSVADNSGATTSCNFNVIVTAAGGDTIPPVITFCPQNQQPTVAVVGQSTVVTYPNAQADDNSGGTVGLSYSLPSGSTFQYGPTTVVVTATDPSGNTATCQFVVTVSTTSNPLVLTCPADVPISVVQGTTSAIANFGTATPSGGRPPYGAVTCNRNSGTFFALGTTTVTCSVTDSSGTTVNCNFNVVVSLIGQGLTVTCPRNQAVTITSGTGANVYFERASASGGNGVYTYQYSQQSGSLFPASVNTGSLTTLTVTASDSAGTSDTCSFTVTGLVNAAADADTLDPITICPDNIVTTIPAQLTTASVNLPSCTTANNGGPGYAYIRNAVNHNTGTAFNDGQNTFNRGTTIVRCNSRDGIGNLGSCVFSVTVNTAGLTPPTVAGCNLPNGDSATPDSPNTNTKAAAGASSAVVIYTAPSAGSSPVMTHNSLNTGSTFPLGLTDIIYIFGTLGAQTTCTYYVYVGQSTDNPCTSSPCYMDGTSTCFFDPQIFICRGDSRRRRDADALTCDPFCELNGGICEQPEGYLRPSCFYPGFTPEIEMDKNKKCQYRPCMNNATCIDTYDEFMNPSYECVCPSGWKGSRCETHERTHDLEKPDNQMFAYWFVGGVLGLLGFVVVLLAAMICWIMLKKMSSVPRAEDEKVLVNY